MDRAETTLLALGEDSEGNYPLHFLSLDVQGLEVNCHMLPTQGCFFFCCCLEKDQDGNISLLFNKDVIRLHSLLTGLRRGTV